MRSLLFWFLIIILIVFRYYSSTPDYSEGDRVRIITRVASEPIRYSNSRGLRLEGLWVYLPLFPEVHYGDSVIVEGIVREGKLDDAKLIEVTQAQRPLYSLRRKVIQLFSKALPSPHSSLLGGFVIGSKEGMPRDFWEKLKLTGTAHVVVASGMNVTLVAGFLVNSLVLVLPRRRALFVAIISIWLYALIAGFDAPIIRAAVMGSVGFVGQGLGKIKATWRVFFLAAAAMLIAKPTWVSDLGFILSFVATASLMLFERPIRKRLRKVPKYIREDLSTSLAAQIGVAPILYVTFGYFNIWSPLINALVLWTVAPVTVIAGSLGLIGLLLPRLAFVLLLATYPFTWWFVSVVEVFS